MALMAHRRPHQKSRQGCLVCKRRKIKCDEVKPRCSSCLQFRVSCSFDSSASRSKQQLTVSPAASGRPMKRGRGRPRKDWSCTAQESREASSIAENNAGSPYLQSARGNCMPNTAASISHSLNGADLALLSQFTTQTGRSLAHPDPPDNPVALFWSHNVPQIGLTHHTVMHLLLALAARHLAWLVTQDPETRIQYVSLAENHISAGLTELTMALKTMNDSTCGFLYVSAILVSFCTLAAGPTGPKIFTFVM
ncbi:hypothetical protein BDV09DRAFT_117711 [Aspergillus tetrazonus]